MLQIPDAKKQHLISIENWMDAWKPIVRSEADWVQHLRTSEDFIALKSTERGEGGLENLLDRLLKKWPSFFSMVYFPRYENRVVFLLTLISCQQAR